MNASRNGLEGDQKNHFSTSDGLDTPKFLPDTDKGPSDHAPNRGARNAKRVTQSRTARPR